MRMDLLFSCFLVFSCSSICTPQHTTLDETEQLSFNIITQDFWSPYGRQSNIQSIAYQLFFDSKDWSIFWQNWFVKTIPRVDFKTNFIVYMNQGLKKTGGYEIDIEEVRFDNKKQIVYFLLRITEPKPGQGVDLSETNPFVIAEVKLPTDLSGNIDTYSYKVIFLNQKDNSKIPVELLRL